MNDVGNQIALLCTVFFALGSVFGIVSALIIIRSTKPEEPEE